MFGRVKRWFGIDSVKIKLMPLEAYPRKVETLNGELEISSKHPQTVTYIRIRLIERYERGRGEQKKIDEYQLGEWTHSDSIEIDEDSTQTILFKMPFEFELSAVEKMGSKGPIRRGLAAFAKRLKGAKSTYRLEAEAVVEGTKINPFDKAKIEFV